MRFQGDVSISVTDQATDYSVIDKYHGTMVHHPVEQSDLLIETAPGSHFLGSKCI